jgi:periplasmic glucans biosynthesis protein
VRPTAAETVATRVGRGWDDNSRRFVIDFKGGKLDSLPADAPVAAVVSATSGTVSHVVAQHNDVAGGWRAFFEIVPEGDKDIELRCFLKLGDEALTETWSYRWYA